MARFLGGLLLVAIWGAASAFLFFPVALMGNGLLATGCLLLILASLIAGLVAYLKRKDSLAYALAAAPGLVAAVAAAGADLLR